MPERTDAEIIAALSPTCVPSTEDQNLVYAMEHGEPGDTYEQAMTRAETDRRIAESMDGPGPASELTEVDRMIAESMDRPADPVEFRRALARERSNSFTAGTGMERAELDIAVDSLTDAYLKHKPGQTYEAARRMATEFSDQMLSKRRKDQPTERAALEAAATDVTGLAAFYRRPSTPARSATETSVDRSSGSGRRTDRIRESRNLGGLNPLN